MENNHAIAKQKGSKIEKTIEYLTYAMILLFYTGKVFQIFVILIDILFLFLLYARQERHFVKQHKTLLLMFGVFFVYLGLQSLFAINVKAALSNGLGMIRFVILLFALWYVFNTKEKIHKLIYSVLVIVFLLFVDSTYQYYSGTDIFGFEKYGGYRLTAWDSRAKLGMFLPVFSGIVFASIFIIKRRWFAVVGAMMLLMMVFFSGNKGPLIYLTASIVTVLLLSHTYRKYLLPILVILGMMFAVAVSTNDVISARFAQFKNPLSAKNTSGRNQIYETAIEMIKEHPLLGMGSRNFNENFPFYYQKVYDRKKETTYYDDAYLKQPALHTHSVLLSFLVNWGLIGTILFFAILFYIYRKYIRHNDVALLASVGLFYCIAPFNFGNTVARSQWQFYIFLTLAFVVILAGYKKSQETQKDRYEIS